MLLHEKTLLALLAVQGCKQESYGSAILTLFFNALPYIPVPARSPGGLAIPMMKSMRSSCILLYICASAQQYRCQQCNQLCVHASIHFAGPSAIRCVILPMISSKALKGLKPPVLCSC